MLETLLAERLDCDICTVEQAKVSENGRTATNEMRCAHRVLRNRRRSRSESNSKTSVSKPGDRPSWPGASAACTCTQMRSKADSAKPIEPVRFHCAPSLAQLLPNLPISPEDFHDGMSTFPVFQWHGVVDDNTRVAHAHLSKCTGQVGSARNSSVCFALRWTTLPDDNRDECCLKSTRGVPSGLTIEQHGRHRCIYKKFFAPPDSSHNVRHFRNFYV